MSNTKPMLMPHFHWFAPRRFQFSLKRPFVITALIAIGVALPLPLLMASIIVPLAFVVALIFVGMPLAMTVYGLCNLVTLLMNTSSFKCSLCRGAKESDTPCPQCGP
jgi:hypothetical protein